MRLGLQRNYLRGNRFVINITENLTVDLSHILGTKWIHTIYVTFKFPIGQEGKYYKGINNVHFPSLIYRKLKGFYRVFVKNDTMLLYYLYLFQ